MSLDDPAAHREGRTAANADLSEARHDAYAPRHQKPSLEPVHGASSSNRYMTAAEWQQQVESQRQLGNQLVSKGENLRSIAEEWLQMSNQPTDRTTVNHEMDRIIAVNRKQYPDLARTRTVHPNMILQVWTPDLGPDMSTRYSAWQKATPGTVTIVGRGQQVYAEHAELVATPGSRIALGPDSAGYVAPGARVKDADQTALIVNYGGTIEHNRGADYIEIPANPPQQAQLVTRRQPAPVETVQVADPAPAPPKEHRNFFEKLFGIHPHPHDQVPAGQRDAQNPGPSYNGGNG